MELNYNDWTKELNRQLQYQSQPSRRNNQAKHKTCHLNHPDAGAKQKKKERKKDEESQWDLCETIKTEQYTHFVNTKNRRERKGGESIFKTTVAEKNSFLGRKTNIHIKEFQRIPNMFKTPKSHITQFFHNN